MTKTPPLILLMGPTASGKTALALTLAKAFNGEIISVDSALVYRGMDIGTAKPSMEERAGIPHHLIDITDPADAYSTGQFRTDALKLIDSIIDRGKLPILAGGTMLYFNALTRGLAELPKADTAIRARLQQELDNLGSTALHRRLQTLDPAAAAKIHPHDPQRIQRALEVYEVSGRPISTFFTPETPEAFPYQPIRLVLAPTNRAELHTRIAQRFQAMLRQGFIEEVDALRRRDDLNGQTPALRTVGYRQIWSYLEGEYGYDVMIEKSIAATRQLAKRQFTWLRRENEAIIYDSMKPNVAAQALADVERSLSNSVIIGHH